MLHAWTFKNTHAKLTLCSAGEYRKVCAWACKMADALRISIQFRYFLWVPFCCVWNSRKTLDHRDNVNCILSDDSSAAGLSFYSIKWRNTTLFYPRIKIHVSTSPYIVPSISIYTSFKNLESYHCICSRWRSCLFSSPGQFFFLHKGEITVVKQNII